MSADEPLCLDEEAWSRFDAHVERYLGQVDLVYHECQSDIIHLDVYRFAPTAERPFNVLLTVNMSALPMNVPDEHILETSETELMICLPADWPLDHESFDDNRNYWPLRWLKSLARMPYLNDTWLWAGHTMQTANPPAPVADGVDFRAFLVSFSKWLPEAGRMVHLGEFHAATLLTIMPLYLSEMEFKLKEGCDALLERFRQHGIDHVVQVGRPNVCP